MNRRAARHVSAGPASRVSDARRCKTPACTLPCANSLRAGAHGRPESRRASASLCAAARPASTQPSMFIAGAPRQIRARPWFCSMRSAHGRRFATRPAGPQQRRTSSDSAGLPARFTPDFQGVSRRTSSAFHAELPGPFPPNFTRLSLRTSRAFHSELPAPFTPNFSAFHSALRPRFTPPLDESLEQSAELARAPEVLRMPLHADAEPGAGLFDRLDDAVWRRGGDDETRRGLLDGLMMPAVDGDAVVGAELRLRAATRGACRRRRGRRARRRSWARVIECASVVPEALGMSWISVPPAATLRTCAPRQIARTGRSRASASRASASS